MAATNRPVILDPALLRPGRNNKKEAEKIDFDEAIYRVIGGL
jgi:ATP-dependent Zn protease